MAKLPQPDLFAASLDGFKPLSGDGPRLWIRRLVIWSALGEPIIQDVKLRRGLNIVWSPDADAEGGHMGHGGGKTSFCRLIRYCLGEDSYGTDVQRQRIAAAMPDARVGAEIILDGELWNVIRPIGAGAGASSHYAQKGGTLEEIFQSEMPNPTMAPLRQAIAEATMPSAGRHIPVGSSMGDAWEAALAWLTRDQECRLLDILDWRAPETQSRSPSRNMSKSDRLKVVRLLLKALQQDEIDATRRAQEHKQKADEAARRKERIGWTREEIGRDLKQTFGGGLGEEASLDLWASSANAAAQAEEARVDPEAARKLSEAKELIKSKDGEIRQTELRLATIDGELPGLIGMLRIMDDNLAAKDLVLQNANNPICRTCGRVLEECDHEFIAIRRAEREEEAGDRLKIEQKQRELRAEQDRLKLQRAAAYQELERRVSALTALEQASQAAAEKVASAKGYVTLTQRFRSFAAEIQRLEKLHSDEQERAAKARREADDSRAMSQHAVKRLSELFHITVQYLVPDGPDGKVLLNESGILPVIGLHGDLSTAAIESLKVVAFDLAALLLTIEGKAELPGFWLHDSPREADLGLQIYHRIFELALWLESQTDIPQFQYVITTTTAPPEKLRSEPWRILELSSAPTEARLFKRDL